MKNVIVTGANGFIGKNLVKNLVRRGYKVVALDVYLDDEINDSVTFISVKNKTIEDLASELNKEYTCLYNLAWVGTSGTLRVDYNTQLNNVKLTCDYIRLAAMINCPRVIYASSINEIETYEYLQSNVIDPSGGYIYGTGKLAAHFMGAVMANQNEIEFIPVLITNIYGVGEKSSRLIYSSIVKLLKGEHCSYTEGNQIYDFIYVEDAINSIIEVSEKGNKFTRYYIGSGNPKPLREFLMEMRDVVAPNETLGLGDLEFKGKSIDYNQFNLKQVEKETGYINEVSFKDGIRMTMEYIKREEGL